MVTKCFDFFNKWHIVSLIQLLGHPWISTSRWAAGWNVSHEEKPKKVFVALEKGFSIFLKNTLAIPGHFLFVLSFPFLQQWTNYKVWTKIVHDWIWTRPFWYRKWRLCHSHCPKPSVQEQKIFGDCHILVVLSAPTIPRPGFKSLEQHLDFFQLILFKLELYLLLEWENDENKRKRGQDWSRTEYNVTAWSSSPI